MKIFTSAEIDKQIETYCKLNKKRKNFSDHYKFVVSVVYLMPYVDRRFSENDFVFINQKRLRNLISEQETNNILNNLIEWGIIECDNHFIKKEKSKGYRLVNRKIFKWKLKDLTDIKLINKIQKKRIEIKKNIYQRGKGYQVVSFWTDFLEIDYLRADKYIKNHFDTGSEERKSYLSSISLINEKEIFQSVDETSYRFHSNLTNLATPLRKFLTVNGEKLYNVDIKCSQPTFLALLMSKRPNIDPTELSILLDICEKGRFYEYMSEKSGLNLDLTNYKIRKEFKEKIFSGCLFDKNRENLSKWELIFNSLFPTIFAEIRNIKSIRYNQLAVMLQKEESEFIFKTVAKIQADISKSTPILTIHDSIISTKEGINIVLKYMKEEFYIKYKFNPILSIELL